jgi:subtilisin family serine protease
MFSPLAATDKISPRIDHILSSLKDGQTIKVWIYFEDKDTSPTGFQKAAANFTPQALHRREKVPFDWFDLPVREEYINDVIDLGCEHVRASRWLNAVSARLSRDQVPTVAKKDFVRRIELVATAVREPMPELIQPEFTPTLDSSVYGYSFTQNHLIGSDSLHKIGLTGSGVLLAFFDTGYLTTHFAFDSLNIRDTWNFIDSIADVTDMANGQTNHGTATLSTCGGFDEGILVGPAYKADYILAKTEIENVEIRVEEDNWVMAAEWADSLGADIISSSLGYSDWYTYADMDGKTAITSIAATIAASRGILVVISAGNEGNKPWRYITAPADADSVIAVGAVSPIGTITAFSSFGPTADGRMKPEMVAMGSGIVCARDSGGYYANKMGTSLSAPLIAGGAALVLEAIPSLKGRPMEIRRRLIESADRYDTPDYQYGHGIPDLALAAGFGLRILPIPIHTVRIYQDTVLTFSTLAPPGESVSFDDLDVPAGALFTDLGDGTATLWYEGDPDQPGLRQFSIAAAAGEYGDTLNFSINTIASSEIMMVGPNPCHDSLRIYVNQNFEAGYEIEIFTLSGELIYNTYRYESVFTWPTVNHHGEKVASGVYIIRFSADDIVRKVKIFKM